MDLGRCLAVSYQPSHVRKAAICLPRLSYLFATVEGLPKPPRTVTLPLYTPNGQVDGHLGLDSHCSKNVQVVTHWSTNPEVPGSIPGRGTGNFRNASSVSHPSRDVLV
ncbi:hypothetical protein DPMN_162354 [Dreissena polymorpha]|uniref:Uncharacterized protein n=1 Tax=Dreissena polymorpha TaxID=45954 RepID=A0A9D4IRX8_DREPO|nr:hypothetical protein DPMN_162354 [Dreissena polymorpha]